MKNVYRTARYVILNNVTSVAFESKMKNRIKTAIIEDKWKQFEEPVFGHIGFFQRWQLGVEYSK